MYDALDEAGILNVGATANSFINVDEHGDLPTNCSSELLIGVINTNNRDELDFVAFGRQHRTFFDSNCALKRKKLIFKLKRAIQLKYRCCTNSTSS